MQKQTILDTIFFLAIIHAKLVKNVLRSIILPIQYPPLIFLYLLNTLYAVRWPEVIYCYFLTSDLFAQNT